MILHFRGLVAIVDECGELLRYCTPAIAKRYVHDELALVLDGSPRRIHVLRWIGPPQVRAVRLIEVFQHHAVSHGYDIAVRDRLCTRDELRRVPFVGDIDRLLCRGKNRRTGMKQAA